VVRLPTDPDSSGRDKTDHCQPRAHLARSLKVFNERLNLFTCVFFQEITVYLLGSNKYLLLPACNYWFYRVRREKINYSMPRINFGKTKPSQIKTNTVNFIPCSLLLALTFALMFQEGQAELLCSGLSSSYLRDFANNEPPPHVFPCYV